jgi:hypothetical protein
VREVSSPASLLGPAVGAFLFTAELMQARRLATGDVQATRQAARTIGSTRVAFGGLFAARPQLFARLLHGCPDPTTRSETGGAVCRQPREQPDESRESAGK